MAYGDFKYLTREAAFDKVLSDKAFNFAKNSKYNGYQSGLASMVYTFFDKKSAAAGAHKPSGTSTHKGTGINPKYQYLAEEINKPIVEKC